MGNPVLVLTFGIVIIGWILLSIYVGMDADEHNMSGGLWFFITLLTGILGIAIYLLVRD